MKTHLIYKVDGEQIGTPIETDSISLGSIEIEGQKLAVDSIEQPKIECPDPNYVPVTIVHCKRYEV